MSNKKAPTQAQGHMKERNDSIYKDYMDGACVLELADKYSLSCYRIVEILRSDPDYGLTKTRLDWQRNTQAKHTRNKQIYKDKPGKPTTSVVG